VFPRTTVTGVVLCRRWSRVRSMPLRLVKIVLPSGAMRIAARYPSSLYS
jgi:hypothetical protein